MRIVSITSATRILFLKYNEKNNTKKAILQHEKKSPYITKVVKSDFQINFSKEKNGNDGPIQAIEPRCSES